MKDNHQYLFNNSIKIINILIKFNNMLYNYMIHLKFLKYFKEFN